MPKRARELTAIEVARLSKPGLYAVGNPPGLYLQIVGQARSWILRVKIGSKRRDMGLGPFPGVTLAQAREKARGARAQIEEGQDPILLRKQAQSALKAAQASALTFADAVKRFLDARSDEWTNSKHRKQWTSTLETYAFPIMGNVYVADISQAHVMSVLEPIWRAKTETATRLRGRIERVLDWATASGYRTGENPALWRGRLDHLLPKPTKITTVEHHPALPIDEIGKFMVELRTRDGNAARALEFAILNASRSIEVRGARWSEIDLDAAIWKIPSARMKMKKEHRVPLSKAAIQLLEKLPRTAGIEFIFPAPSGSVLSDMALAQVIRRMNAPCVPHGFRSTFRDWAAERTNFPREIAEIALAHSIKGDVEGAYWRGDVLDKRRQLMEAWSKFCSQTRTTGDIYVLHKSTQSK
jgi:integrase